jgi:ubiquinone/menaquinone biosynthesis C-methylase UbiE
MTLRFMRDNTPGDFEKPNAAPETDEQAQDWQEKNRSWWESHPMRYDFGEATHESELTIPFYDEVDRRFLKSIREETPWSRIPFDTFIDFEKLKRESVLEIGVGCGTHAELLTRHAGSYTGIDLTSYAVKATARRLELKSLPGRVIQMDAEKMSFPDATFDFVWSWGVIHHSSNTRRILGEIARVLKPGGHCTVMVYHTSLWNTWVRGGLYYGILRGGFLRTRSVHRLLQETTDGALARYYTREEWKAEVDGLFRVDRTWLLGHRTQLVPLPWGKLKDRIGAMIPGPLGRWITNRPLFAYMVVASMTKK